MTPSVLNSTNTLDLASMLIGLLQHLTDHDLPEPSSLGVDRSREAIAIQPFDPTPDALPRELLAWAESLTGAVIELLRLAGGRVHINISGRLAIGQEVRLYTKAPDWLVTEHHDVLDERGHVVLAPSVLRNWAITDSGVIA